MCNVSRLGLFALAALTMVGCSTVVNGTHEDIEFTSEPEGADVVIAGVPHGKTPATIGVKRSWDPVTVEFRMDGYKTSTVEMVTQLEEVTLVNIIFPIGFAVDYVSDAMHRFEEEKVHVTLERQ